MRGNKLQFIASEPILTLVTILQTHSINVEQVSEQLFSCTHEYATTRCI